MFRQKDRSERYYFFGNQGRFRESTGAQNETGRGTRSTRRPTSCHKKRSGWGGESCTPPDHFQEGTVIILANSQPISCHTSVNLSSRFLREWSCRDAAGRVSAADSHPEGARN